MNIQTRRHVNKREVNEGVRGKDTSDRPYDGGRCVRDTDSMHVRDIYKLGVCGCVSDRARR